MNEEKLEKYWNKVYYDYLEQEEAKELIDYYKNMEQENKQLKEDLRVSQSNEETYCLEMQEITKILGLDEHTLFDDVKDYAKQLKEEIRKMKNSKLYKILKEWEEFIENKEFNNYTDFEYRMKLFKLKEKYK